jgi:hypothetical protein
LLILAGLAGRLDRSRDGVRVVRALLAAVAGLALALGGALADTTLHRGVESGAERPVVRHATGRDLATNVDLTRFAPEQVPQVAAALQANGFRYVRQSFAWADIEPAPGQFAWERYDAIVGELSRRGIAVVAVLHRSPGWSRQEGGASWFDAPPVDLGAWERFVGEVSARYGATVPFVQLWDLPNRPDRWGGIEPDVAAYTGLLALGSNAARAANPTVTVVLAEFDPRPDPRRDRRRPRLPRWCLCGGRGAVLRRIAAAYPAATAPPTTAGLTTRRRRSHGRSCSGRRRSRRGTSGSPSGPPTTGARGLAWLGRSGPDPATAAAYAIAGIERARAEWPWMGPLFAWGLTPGPSLGGEVAPDEALLGADGLPTTLLSALGGFAAEGGTDTAPTGFLPVTPANSATRATGTSSTWGPRPTGRRPSSAPGCPCASRAPAPVPASASAVRPARSPPHSTDAPWRWISKPSKPRMWTSRWDRGCRIPSTSSRLSWSGRASSRSAA